MPAKTALLGCTLVIPAASLARAGDKLFLLTNDGELRVARASGKAFEPLRVYSVADSPTWAHPLVLEKGFVIKDATTLALWSS